MFYYNGYFEPEYNGQQSEFSSFMLIDKKNQTTATTHSFQNVIKFLDLNQEEIKNLITDVKDLCEQENFIRNILKKRNEFNTISYQRKLFILQSQLVN